MLTMHRWAPCVLKIPMSCRHVTAGTTWKTASMLQNGMGGRKLAIYGFYCPYCQNVMQLPQRLKLQDRKAELIVHHHHQPAPLALPVPSIVTLSPPSQKDTFTPPGKRFR
jgi:hypothetical protein